MGACCSRSAGGGGYVAAESKVEEVPESRRRRGLAAAAAAVHWPGRPLENEENAELPLGEFEEDLVGMTICAVVRDNYKIAIGSGAVSVRVFRVLLTYTLLTICLGIQFFLILNVDRYVTAKDVYEIRVDYARYERHMYGNHTEIDSLGFERGIGGPTGQFFKRANFRTMPEEWKDATCHIPASQIPFLFCVLLIWTFTCIGEFKNLQRLIQSLLINTPRVSHMGMALQPESGNNQELDSNYSLVVVGLTLGVKLIIVFCVLLPHALITTKLLWLGCQWLYSTNDFTELVLNAVALEFILILKDQMYFVLVSDRSKRDRSNTRIQPRYKYQVASIREYSNSLIWTLGSCVYVYLYIHHLQTVLPDYRGDVHDVCTSWFLERYVSKVEL